MDIVGNQLIPSGRLGAEESPDLERALTQLCEANEREVVADLTGVEFVSSLCLGAFVVAHFTCEKNGRKLVIRVPQRCVQFFEFSNLHKILNVEIVD
jgi:anti-anti-sigma factor